MRQPLLVYPRFVIIVTLELLRVGDNDRNIHQEVQYLNPAAGLAPTCFINRGNPLLYEVLRRGPLQVDYISYVSGTLSSFHVF